MVLPLPKRFDANEWFIILTMFFGYLAVYFIPKRCPHSISLILVLFCFSTAVIYDHAIASPPVEMYYINDYKNYELFDVVTYFMYSPYALIAVYLYDKIAPKGLGYTTYIVLWSVLCVAFEWLAIQCHVFTFTKWHLFYSLSVYLVMTTLLLRLFEYLQARFHTRSASI